MGDPDVGIEHTGSLIKDIKPHGDLTYSVDLSAVQIVVRAEPRPPEPEAPEPEEILDEVEEEIATEPLEEAIPEEAKIGFASLSPLRSPSMRMAS
ncbi:MAG: hypothetical protein LBJ70_00670 [Holosporales bacterium]|nr:hypothetical protein [Holosporales bacterium]